MSHEDVIRLAEQAGFEIEQPSDGHNVSGDNACLERFAALVADAEGERVTLAALQAAAQTTAVVVEGIQAAVLAEREACAQACDEIHAKHIAEFGDYIEGSYATECAAAIRARGKA